MTELRQTLRRLAARPTFTFVVVLTLGIGIGANTAIFSAVHHLILAPMPFEDGDRLAFVWRQAAAGRMLVTPDPEVAHAWLDAEEAIEGVGLWRAGEATLLGDGPPERIDAYGITAGLPALLGVPPLVGRTFTAEEARERTPVVLLSESLWRSRLGARRGVVGRTLQLDDVVYTVIGVMPDRFSRFNGRPGGAEVWTPLAREDLTGMAGSVGALVRVREDATLEQASEELHALAVGARAEDDGMWRYRAVAPQEFLGDDTRRALLVLLGAVTVVLLIACANIAALLLIRLSDRRRDLAVRAALGAARGRLVLSHALELGVLAILGGAAGLFLASWTIDAIHALRPPHVDGLGALSLNPHVLLYAGGLALATTALFGIAPTLVLARRDPGSPFRTAIGSGDRVVESGRGRAALVIGQIALSVALLAGAGLLVRTVANLRGAELGFQAEGLVTLDVPLPADRYTPEMIPVFVERMNEALAAIPGVVAATDAVAAPPDMGISHGALHIEGRTAPGAAETTLLPSAFVGPGFFGVLGAPVLEGRDLTDDDAGQRVAVVDRFFAREHWPDEEAVGKRFRLSDEGEWTTVVGIVGEVAGNGPGRPTRGAVYYANSRSWERQGFLVRVAGRDPTIIVPAVREALVEIDPLLALGDVETVRQQLADAIAGRRFFMVLLAAFAGIALLLSALGLYGLVAFALARRTREIGIRLALGAAPDDVRDMLLRGGARLAAAGTVLGLAGALAGARVLDGLLHGVQPRDPAAFAAAALLAAATALLASWLPARRATRVDPMLTLKSE